MVDSRTMLGLRWDESLLRDSQNAPLLSPWFVAEQGPAVQIADIRPVEEATGALGYIPGSVFASSDRLEEMAGTRPAGAVMEGRSVREALAAGAVA